MARQNYVTFGRITKCFGALPVVEHPFDLSIPHGQFVVFLGPSGCGKTTLMRMVGGLDAPTSGVIHLDGQRVGAPDQRRGMVFQAYSSFPWLTVRQNVAFGTRYRRDLSAEQKRRRTDHYLALVGLTDFADAFPNRISGGMRQRVAIARTLAAEPDVLLMDEPFGALDAQRRELLQSQLRDIQMGERKTVIFVTHDVEEAVFLGDRVIVFSARPARIVADIDIVDRLGLARDLALRESEPFFRLRNEILNIVRHETGVTV
jgi:NitT/TauT family transport system ATP-binding protein